MAGDLVHREPSPQLRYSSGEDAFAALGSAVAVIESVAQDATDGDLLSAAGKACANGQTPRSFAESFAAQHDMRESRVLSRLMAYGIAKSGWSWT